MGVYLFMQVGSLEETRHEKVPLTWPEKLYSIETICQMERVSQIQVDSKEM